MEIEKISHKDVESLRSSLIAAKLKPSTINDYRNIINAICNYAIKTDIYDGKNPTKYFEKLKVDNRREKFLTKSEILDLLESVKSDATLLLFTKLSLSVGGRMGTVLNIKKRDVDLENEIITLKNVKSNKTYNGYITDSELTDLLKNRMKSIGNNDFLIGKEGVKNAERYIRKKMKVIYDELFNYDLDPNDVNYNKYKVVNHTLRHTFCSTLGMKGVSPFEIQTLSNHSNLSSVMWYVKLSPQFSKDKVNGLYD